MLQLLAICAALVFKSNAEDCTQPLQQFVGCMKTEARYYSEIINEETSNQFRRKVDECFKKYKCNVPQELPIEHNLTSIEAPVFAKFRTWFDGTSLVQKHCIIDALRLNFRPKLTKCIKQQLPNFEVPKAKDGDVKPEVLSALKKTAEFRLQIERATRKCPGHIDDVDACIYNLRKESFEDTCKVRKDCNLDNSLGCNDICYSMSDSCRDFVKVMRPKACKCATEGQKENRKFLKGIEDKDSFKNLHSLLFTEDKNVLSEKIKACGAGLPPQVADKKLEKKISLRLRLRITEYIDAYGDRDVTFCHDCPDQEI